MATEREPPTATDYVVTALSPVLVMLMVGSLVFFLVEVLYEGKYSGRLLYTLFFFVVGAVLIARIAIETDASRASLYGLFLGGATYLALLRFVEYPGGGWMSSFGWFVNLGLMLLIWWSAHKLTWDCTHIDERQKGAGRGLLSAAGLESGAGNPESETSFSRDPKGSVPASAKRKKSKRSKHDSRLWDWIERYQKHREARRAAPHTPGVWVIYFALAALPLFALGQSLISPDDASRRQTTFLQMVVYVGSALALLVTTSLLGLRRYLRQRKAKIPMSLSGGWLGLGALFIAVFLVIGAFLPRPHSEVPWFGIPRAGKSDRDASTHAMLRDGNGKGEGTNGSQTKAGDGKGVGKDGQPGGENGDGKDGSGKDGKSDGGKAGKSDGGKDGTTPDSRSRDPKGSESASNDDSQDNDGGTRGTAEAKHRLAAAVEQLVNKLKWLVFAIVAVLVGIAVLLVILRYLAPFTQWAQRLLEALAKWWANLFAKKSTPGLTSGARQETGPVRPPPFAEFSNPFADGTARGRDPAELVAYTFLALDSWATDRDCGREQAETPLEFVSRLGELFPDLGEQFSQFAKVYARVSYSHTAPPADALAVLEETWEGMVQGEMTSA
ncbi:MAG: hypothetical protein C0467_23090 [Planctomycetaceae bacterium]|nr:hypothetical protein [Planctomycetaceae bacterium]